MMWDEYSAKMNIMNLKYIHQWHSSIEILKGNKASFKLLWISLKKIGGFSNYKLIKAHGFLMVLDFIFIDFEGKSLARSIPVLLFVFKLKTNCQQFFYSNESLVKEKWSCSIYSNNCLKVFQ